MREFDGLFAALARSRFRSRFRLRGADRRYLETKGLETIMRHAADFITQRLAPAHPPRDGRQTPYRGHPVFVAQHATACCCRSCLEKWHHIPAGQPLDAAQTAYVFGVLERWLRIEAARPPPVEGGRRLGRAERGLFDQLDE